MEGFVELHLSRSGRYPYYLLPHERERLRGRVPE
jgi:hypothetical protein